MSTQPSTQAVATTLPIVERTFRRPTIDAALVDGIDFLVRSQQPDGSWGTGLETRGTEIMSMVPGSHDAYRVGTTALCVMALREAVAGNASRPGVVVAHAKGLKYLLAHGEAKRDTAELMYNTWAHIFALQAIVEEMKADGRNTPLATAAREQMDRLNRYASYIGGWNYYDFGSHTEIPSAGGTSFGTAAGLIALYEAKQVGIDAPPKLQQLAVHRLEECKLPNGVFTYGADYKYSIRIPANMERGAIGRTQPSNFALMLWDSPKVTLAGAAAGLDMFFSEHAFLEMGRKQPWPHQSWYQTSGYYYYFDHYYAARLIDKLDQSHRKSFDEQLLETIMPHQEADGSWWDYAMWDYHKPYGTAFAVMTLLRCRD